MSYVIAAMYGTTLPWGEILGDFALDQGGREQSVVWGRSDRVPAAMAALVNGTLVHGFELDDLHKASILHPSSTCVPAALAVAESRARPRGVAGAADPDHTSETPIAALDEMER